MENPLNKLDETSIRLSCAAQRPLLDGLEPIVAPEPVTEEIVMPGETDEKIEAGDIIEDASRHLGDDDYPEDYVPARRRHRYPGFDCDESESEFRNSRY